VFQVNNRPSARLLLLYSVRLQVKMLALSGLKVDGLAIRGVKYKPFKGVRSVTQAGKFQVRCAAF
jgi:AP-3 complex subunit mu